MGSSIELKEKIQELNYQHIKYDNLSKQFIMEYKWTVETGLVLNANSLKTKDIGIKEKKQELNHQHLRHDYLSREYIKEYK